MPLIRTETFIRAPIELCFDLSRDVDAHTASTSQTSERAVAGITSGMMELGDEVTWEATHFGIRQRLTAKITLLERPHRFVDEMQRSAFKRLIHAHLFKECEGGTLMRDEVEYASPLGLLGRVIDRLFLEKYMTRLLLRRNAYLKRVAEERGFESVSGAPEARGGDA